MTREILQIGQPILREKARLLTVEEILSDEVQALIKTMINTMHAAPGVGLAAPQIGESLRIIVIEDKPEYTKNIPVALLTLRQRNPTPLHVLINPEILTSTSDDKVSAEFFEGCLSIESYLFLVPRLLNIKITALNENAEPIQLTAHGWLARILQHEIDHLNGKLCVDRMKPFSMISMDSYEQYWLEKPIVEFLESIKDCH